MGDPFLMLLFYHIPPIIFIEKIGGNSALKNILGSFSYNRKNYSRMTLAQTRKNKIKKGYIMARKCDVSGKGPLTGNNVSHANNKTKRRQLPNLRSVKITLEDGTTRRIKVAASELRTMKKKAAQTAAVS